MRKALFLANNNDLQSDFVGGVQICTRYFLKIIEDAGFDLQICEVDVSKKLLFRLLRKLRIDSYRFYDTEDYLTSLIMKIKEENIGYIFLNKTDLIRFSKPLKSSLGENIKIILLSHGNDTGDDLHDIVLGRSFVTKVGAVIEKYRLGLNLYTEAYYRKSYIDLVCCLSETEIAIEKWLGAKAAFFIPQIIDENKSLKWVPISGVIGYIGTLNHTPNYQALISIINELKADIDKNVKLQIIGGPVDVGRQLEIMSDKVEYCGKLNDEDAHAIMKSWSVFLNPIFWHSKGASMKLSTAISLGLPIVTTEAGRRGYVWGEGTIPESANNPSDFIQLVYQYYNDMSKLKALKFEVEKVQASIPTSQSIGQQMRLIIDCAGEISKSDN